MSKNDIITKIETIRELEDLIEEAKAEADALRDLIKQQMLAEGTEELEAQLQSPSLKNTPNLWHNLWHK